MVNITTCNIHYDESDRLVMSIRKADLFIDEVLATNLLLNIYIVCFIYFLNVYIGIRSDDAGPCITSDPVQNIKTWGFASGPALAAHGCMRFNFQAG